MKVFKRIFLALFLIVLSALAIFLYINLHNPREPLPVVGKQLEEAVDFQNRPWWEAATVYQVYPRSFQDSNGDGIGDIPGIIMRLDYIRDLGFEAIWFSPFFQSPQQDFGYDISDYQAIAPEYGTMADVDSLIAAMHRRGMKVVFDLVLNHTSDQHAWFQESRSSRDNPKADWYVWRDGNGKEPPNNWHNALGKSGWHYAPERDQWYYAAFLPFQPDLNWWNPVVKDSMFAMVQYWLDKGVDGFRLDIFNFIYEDEQFRDNPRTLRYLPGPDMQKMNGQHLLYNLNHPQNIILARELRSILDDSGAPERFMVGEVFGYHRQLRQLLGESEDGLNLVFLLEMANGLRWDVNFFREEIRTFEAFYPYPYSPTYVFSNHDGPRSISQLGDDVRKARLLALIQFSLRGVPFTYQGEEIGMPNGNIPLDEALDPLPAAIDYIPDFIRNSGLIFNRDNCRTPMQWEAGANAGFTTPQARPWLEVQANCDSINVERQKQQDSSLLQTYQSLLALRRKNLPLQWGSLQLLEGQDLPTEVLAYRRSYQGQVVEAYVNFSERAISLPAQGELLISIGEPKLTEGQLKLGALEGVILGMPE